MCRNTLIPFLNGRTPPFLKSLFKSTQRQSRAFSRVTTPSQSISPPCCSMLFHSSTMPCNSNARLIYAIPLLLTALPILCVSIHFCSRASRRSTSQFLCVAMLGSALPCSTLPLLCAA
nr:MAG TPA: hypothetical protein [Caudoviricetes sp.]